MQAVANNPKFAKKVGVNQSTGQEFTKENGMKKNYMYGGKVKKMMGGGMADKAGARAMPPAMKKRMEMDMMKAKPGGMKMGGKVKKMNKGGPTARTKHIMNEKEEISRVDKEIRKNEGYKAGGMMKDKEGRAMKKGGKVKKQGYNARLDDSLGARKGKKKQSMKARRDESKGAKKAAGKKAYSGNRKSAQGSASKRADGIAKKGRTKGRIV